MISILQTLANGVTIALLVFVAQSVRDPDRLVGRVTNQHGCPLPGVAVTAIRDGRPSIGAVTDGRGEYVIAGIPRGMLTVVAKESGFVTRSETLSAHRGENRWDTSLNLGRLADPPPHPVSGRLMSAGSPVANATVTIVEALSSARVEQVRTDTDGRYRFEEPDAGDFILIVTSPTIATVSRAVSLPLDDGAPAVVDFEVVPRVTCGK
jgi:Carboxypeptidase regulatory-like domain